MRIDPETGLLEGATHIESPNWDERPEHCDINLVVIHGISLPPGKFGGPEILQFFTNQLDTGSHPFFAEIADMRVSSHLLIRRDGEIIQFVPFNRCAWHAGASCYKGKERCNDFSIGIELEGADDIPYEDVQYERLGTLIRSLRQAYPDIGPDNIVGHCDIAPGRKTDPGSAFDWQHLKRELENA